MAKNQAKEGQKAPKTDKTGLAKLAQLSDGENAVEGGDGQRYLATVESDERMTPGTKIAVLAYNEPDLPVKHPSKTSGRVLL
ncbi:MAG TPA: hypothetical protein VG096_19075 [Bryobacteraceae bacterium]|nr:hypothetical protein [Bryobacteraceae bacterium]